MTKRFSIPMLVFLCCSWCFPCIEGEQITGPHPCADVVVGSIQYYREEICCAPTVRQTYEATEFDCVDPAGHSSVLLWMLADDQTCRIGEAPPPPPPPPPPPI